MKIIKGWVGMHEIETLPHMWQKIGMDCVNNTN